mmetsp:Transcript_49604/g.153168  ORF Transcript_49604/g.153168 Transcript_49604/m.153168 type:complete len:203 (+) Transcript_49604:1129-1737(+)
MVVVSHEVHFVIRRERHGVRVPRGDRHDGLVRDGGDGGRDGDDGRLVLRLLVEVFRGSEPELAPVAVAEAVHLAAVGEHRGEVGTEGDLRDARVVRHDGDGRRREHVSLVEGAELAAAAAAAREDDLPLVAVEVVQDPAHVEVLGGGEHAARVHVGRDDHLVEPQEVEHRGEVVAVGVDEHPPVLVAVQRPLGVGVEHRVQQ